jgi:ABC-type oligopeptide transport system substrate-binding subunit
VFFTFHQPLSQGQLMAFLHMPLLCHKQQSTFCDQTLTPLAATGPYTIQVNGQKIIYKRNPNYWGWHTPFGRGHYRFTKIIYSYFRDRTAAEYAAQSGHIDVWEHENIRHWPTTPGQKWHSHSLIRHVPNRHCMGMFGFIFNTRRSLFAQKPTRQALTDLMQQAFFSQTLFGPPFQPIDHFFAASKSIKTPSPSPHQRSEALSLLNKAGYYLKKGILRHASTHMPFQFDILFTRPEYQKLALVLKDNLKPYGITVTVKRLEALGYAQRRHKFDYDMIIEKWFQTRAPGFEQKLYWSATAATQPGSKNYAGIQDSVIDQQINSLLDSRTTKQMHHHLNKLDQRLKDGCYVIPLYRLPYDFLYHKKNLTAPTTPLTDGCAFNRWWVMLTWWQNNL